jgi:oxygen-independent coproporphyrinogen-3 oxidase
MGVQSFDPGLLRVLGRVHTAEQGIRSYEILRQAGFRNINLDFIFGVPGQTAEIWEETLRRALSLGTEHLSAYCLTYEEDTEFFRLLGQGELLQDDQIDSDLFVRTMELLEDAGFLQYEISNYCRPGYECRHNLAYWRGHDYLGLGPSAVSTVGVRRWKNVPDTSEYIQRIRERGEAETFSEEIDSTVRQAERLAFGLRTARGLAVLEVAPWIDELEPLEKEGYLSFAGDRLRLTRKGRLVADSIAGLFV